MKKLMTMIAAVGMAFGLFADEVADEGFITGAAFEPDPQVTSDKMSWTQANGFDQAYWTNADGANVKTTAATYTYAGSKTPGYPAVFAEEDHTQYATINTTIGNPVDYDFATKAVDIDTGLYFDAMVNMTVFDFGDEPTNSIPSDAKIAVFLRLASNDDNAATNFVVYAGDNQMFVCSSDTKVSAGWHRLTVKAIKNVLTEGQMSAFVVFVDGKAVNCSAAKITDANLTASASLFNKNAQLFKSLDPTATELAGVSFDGKGDVDDIVVTATAPEFAEDPATATITWTPADFESLTIGGYTLDATELAKGKYILTLNDGQTKVNIAWTGAGTVMDNTGTEFDIVNDEVALDSKLSTAKATFEGTKFVALQDAIDYANTNGTAGTLKLLDEATTAITITKTGTVLDLNGTNVTASPISISAAVGIAITVEGEGVVSGVVAAPSSIVTSGTFNGVTTFGTYNGGKFLKSTNLTAPTSAVAGKIFDTGTGADAAYWVLVDKPFFQVNEGDKYPTLAAAIAAAEADDTITLLDDYELDVASEKAFFTKNTTLDLGGKTLTVTAIGAADQFGVASNAVNTVQNGNIVLNEGSLGYRVFGTLVTTANWKKNITIETGNNLNDNGKAHYPMFDVCGTVVVNGGTLLNAEGDVFRSKLSFGTIDVTVNGGTINAYDIFYTYRDQLTYNVTITAGTLTGTKAIFHAVNDDQVVVTLDNITCSLTDACKAKFNENESVAHFLADNYELVKEQDGDFYVIQAKQSTDPEIPEEEGKITPKQGEEGTFVVEPAPGATVIDISNAEAGQTFEIASAADVVVKGANGATIKVVVNDVTIPADALMGAVEGGYSTALNPAGVVDGTPVQPTIGAGVEADDVDIAAGEIAVKSIPGLTYKLVRSEVLGTAGTAVDTKVATGATVELKDATTKGPTEFYVIEVAK